MGRAPCCDKANVKKGPWSPEEDATLKSYIQDHGPVRNWIALPQKIGLKRCGKSCRLRWLNYLRPNIKHGGFSDEEDKIICSLYISIGSRWSIIAAQLPGRTDNDIKNYWNTKLKKKLLGKQCKKGCPAQKDSSERGVCTKTILSEGNSCSVISGTTASGWSELRRGVSDVPLSGLNQNPKSHMTTIGEQSYIWDLLSQLGGRFLPNQRQEAIPITADFLQYPNDSDKVSPYSYYPFESITGLASSQPLSSGSIDEAYTVYNMNLFDRLNGPVVLNHSTLEDFSISQAENLGHWNLLADGNDTSDVYGIDEILNISICSTAPISNNNCQGSNIIWEDISSLLADVDNACRSPSSCHYGVHSQP